MPMRALAPVDIAQAAIKYIASSVSIALPSSLSLHHLNEAASVEPLRVKALWLRTGRRHGRCKHAIGVMQQMPVIAQGNQKLFQRHLQEAAKPLVVALNAGVHNPAANSGGLAHRPSAQGAAPNRAARPNSVARQPPCDAAVGPGAGFGQARSGARLAPQTTDPARRP